MSQKAIPFLSARKINRTEDYVRYFHTKAYIRQKSEQFPDNGRKNPVVRQLMAACGYADVGKFRKHREWWDHLEKDIPIAYLEAIGVVRETLEFTVSLDAEECDSALQVPRYPRYGIIHYMPFAFGTIHLPPNTPEDEAIEIIKNYAREKKLFTCCINYPDLKTICIKPDGKVSVVTFRPSLHFANGKAVFSGDGSLIGQVRIAR